MKRETIHNEQSAPRKPKPEVGITPLHTLSSSPPLCFRSNVDFAIPAGKETTEAARTAMTIALSRHRPLMQNVEQGGRPPEYHRPNVPALNKQPRHHDGLDQFRPAFVPAGAVPLECSLVHCRTNAFFGACRGESIGGAWLETPFPPPRILWASGSGTQRASAGAKC